MKHSFMPHASYAVLTIGILLAAVLTACAHRPDGAGSSSSNTKGLGAAQGAALQSCAALVEQFKFDQTSLSAAAQVAAGSLMLAGQPVAAHCLVKGHMHKRTGTDGRAYAIGFEMRLPTAWNGRFYYQGNGGLDGNVQPAQGATGGGPLTSALMQGFAVISSDAGHTGAQTPFFGAEPQARLDYGYQAVGKLTPMAKSLIQSAYGKGPDRSYIGGCSNGGRHAMVAAARYGDQYDGYLAGAPGYRLPESALAQLWGAQQWSQLATPGATIQHPMNPSATLPDLSTAFTAQERQTVAKAILDKCDTLDGLKDGIVNATQLCQTLFSIANDVPRCKDGERNGSCLTGAQMLEIHKIMGRTGFSFDPGIAGSNWATWKFVNSLALDPLSVGTVFRPEPGPIAPLTANIDELKAQIKASNQVHKESGMSLMSPPGFENPTNLAALKARGAKMVLYHGVSDPIFSSNDTQQWMGNLNRAQSGTAADFARYFPVPGMNHCQGGPATDQFDMLTPLVTWVEHGITPQAITASARGAGNAGGINDELPKDWAASRSRPLCAFPGEATYKGFGDKEVASSFECKTRAF